MEKKCKHLWRSSLNGENITGVILFCEKCGLVRECYEDGYKEYENSKGVYE
jgi:hypothetical protein